VTSGVDSTPLLSERPQDVHAGDGDPLHPAEHRRLADAPIVSGDAVDIVTRLTEEPDVPLRSTPACR
jgi:hypothetical protein